MQSVRSFRGRGRAFDALVCLATLASPLALATLAACEPLPEDGREVPTTAVCEGMMCPADSTCRAVDGEPFCDCDEGFIGSPGFSASACYPATTATGTCRDTDDGIVCECVEGFNHTPNAIECSLIAATCEELACDDNAYCQQLSAGYTCSCKPNFQGDGRTCTPVGTAPTCADLTCGANAACQQLAAGPVCACKPNFEGDGQTCTPVGTTATCADLTCGANATCQQLAAGPVCACKPGFAGDGQTCTYSGVPCGGACPANATCRGAGPDAICECDAGHFGNGATACYPEVTATGTCTVNAAGAISCTCNEGYVHASASATACSDLDECKLEDQGGCLAWCTNTDGGATCTSSVADETSPYWADSCDPTFSETNTQTELIADCRCGQNQLVEGSLGLCQRPTGAYERGFTYGEGPRVADLYENLPRVPAGVMDQATRKIYLGLGYTTPTDSYMGAILEIDADTGNRRVVAGKWPDEFGGTVYGSGITPYLPEVQNLALGPDGYLYAWVRNVNNNAQIVRIDKQTGGQTMIWREHIILQPAQNDPNHAQCSNGSLVPGARNFVQVHERGFLVEASGDFLLSAMAGNTGTKMTPIGVIRISKDGAQCTWVRRASAGSENAFYGQDVGSGAAPQPGVPFRAFYAHEDKVWAIDNFAEVYELDPANAWRTRNFASDIAEDWMAWDAARKVMWFSGSGGGSNTIVAYSPSETPALRWAQPITCDNPSREGFGCIEGPARTCCLNHNPMFFDERNGDVIIQHDLFGTVRIEVETGNTVTFSL